ncbi:hypothetical protein PR048_023975 [Dryococelus australis]|uniref:Uncharacterized protein n=1 Tax=Dryococelus australis TaxID=614101 RepID=A0ABQ9GVN5_9NEOP|nr:hypothetical protein PR048_023975 [Dryococelus australis]
MAVALTGYVASSYGMSSGHLSLRNISESTIASVRNMWRLGMTPARSSRRGAMTQVERLHSKVNSEEIWAALNIEVSSRENPPTSAIVRHDSHLRKYGVNRPGIEPGSPCWEASSLTAQPPWQTHFPHWEKGLTLHWYLWPASEVSTCFLGPAKPEQPVARLERPGPNWTETSSSGNYGGLGGLYRRSPPRYELSSAILKPCPRWQIWGIRNLGASTKCLSRRPPVAQSVGPPPIWGGSGFESQARHGGGGCTEDDVSACKKFNTTAKVLCSRQVFSLVGALVISRVFTAAMIQNPALEGRRSLRLRSILLRSSPCHTVVNFFSVKLLPRKIGFTCDTSAYLVTKMFDCQTFNIDLPNLSRSNLSSAQLHQCRVALLGSFLSTTQATQTNTTPKLSFLPNLSRSNLSSAQLHQCRVALLGSLLSTTQTNTTPKLSFLPNLSRSNLSSAQLHQCRVALLGSFLSTTQATQTNTTPKLSFLPNLSRSNLSSAQLHQCRVALLGSLLSTTQTNTTPKLSFLPNLSRSNLSSAQLHQCRVALLGSFLSTTQATQTNTTPKLSFLSTGCDITAIQMVGSFKPVQLHRQCAVYLQLITVRQVAARSVEGTTSIFIRAYAHSHAFIKTSTASITESANNFALRKNGTVEQHSVHARRAQKDAVLVLKAIQGAARNLIMSRAIKVIEILLVWDTSNFDDGWRASDFWRKKYENMVDLNTITTEQQFVYCHWLLSACEGVVTFHRATQNSATSARLLRDSCADSQHDDTSFWQLLYQADVVGRLLDCQLSEPVDECLLIAAAVYKELHSPLLLASRAKANRVQSPTRFLASGNRAGRCRRLAGFLGYIPSALLRFHLISPSSGLKNSLRAVQIPQLNGMAGEGSERWGCLLVTIFHVEFRSLNARAYCTFARVRGVYFKKLSSEKTAFSDVGRIWNNIYSMMIDINEGPFCSRLMRSSISVVRRSKATEFPLVRARYLCPTTFWNQGKRRWGENRTRAHHCAATASRAKNCASEEETWLLEIPSTYASDTSSVQHLIYTVQRNDGNTARLARRSDEALGARASVACIAPSLLDLGRDTTERLSNKHHTIATLVYFENESECECGTVPNQAYAGNCERQRTAVRCYVRKPIPSLRALPMLGTRPFVLREYLHFLEHSCHLVDSISLENTQKKDPTEERDKWEIRQAYSEPWIAPGFHRTHFNEEISPFLFSLVRFQTHTRQLRPHNGVPGHKFLISRSPRGIAVSAIIKRAGEPHCEQRDGNKPTLPKTKVSMEQRRNERPWETGDPRESPPTSGSENPDEDRTRLAMVGGEQANRPATVTPVNKESKVILRGIYETPPKRCARCFAVLTRRNIFFDPLAIEWCN